MLPLSLTCRVVSFSWDVIAKFIEEHSRGKYKRTGKEVLTKTKEMQKMGTFNMLQAYVAEESDIFVIHNI